MSSRDGKVTYIAHFSDHPATPTDAPPGTDIFDIPGLVRRVRRTRDLSQRDLAALLGVNHSLIARWETGHREPRLSMFRELLHLADLHLDVRDSVTQPVTPMRPDAMRDRAGRRLPAHLDLFGYTTAPPIAIPLYATDRHWCVPHRPARDHLRAQLDRPPPQDHPTRSQLLATLAAAKAEKTKADAALIYAHREAKIAAGDPFETWLTQPCTCPDTCFDLPGCAPECTCRCEDPTYRPPGTTNPWR